MQKLYLLLMYFSTIAVFIVLVYLIINRWVSRFIGVRKEQNDLLRELISKFDNKA